MKILMVCLGNICRSPLAEGILQEKARRAGLNWHVDSAGTNGFHTGEAPHSFSQKVAMANGIDISGQSSRKFVAADLENYDKIFVMASDVLEEMKVILRGKSTGPKVELFLQSLYPGEHVDVPDPWFGEEGGYHDVYAIIDKGCQAIIAKFQAASKQPENN